MCRRYYLTLWIAFWALPVQAKPSLLRQAIQAFEKDDLAQAQTLIDRVTNDKATSGKTWYYRGTIYEKLLRSQLATEEAAELFEKTLAAYHQALALTPDPSQYHSFAQVNLNNLWAYYLDRGRRYYRQENFDKALEQWKYCGKIKVDEPCVVLYTAIAMHQNEGYAQARQYYTQYLAQTKVSPAAVYRALAHLTTQLDKSPQKGLQVIAEALSQHPFDHDLLYEQLALYQKMEQVEDLQQQLTQKIAATPHKAAYYYQLGYWYEEEEQVKEALQQYQKAAELAPGNIAPVRQQGIVHYNQAALLTQEIQEMPDEEFQEKGLILREKITSALEKSLLYLEQARQLQPRDAVTLKHLYILYTRLQKPTQTIKIERTLHKYGIAYKWAWGHSAFRAIITSLYRSEPCHESIEGADKKYHSKASLFNIQ